MLSVVFVLSVFTGLSFADGVEKPQFIDAKSGEGFNDVQKLIHRITTENPDKKININDVYKLVIPEGVYVNVVEDYNVQKNAFIKFLQSHGADLTSPSVSEKIQEVIQKNRKDFQKVMNAAKVNFLSEKGKTLEEVKKLADNTDETDSSGDTDTSDEHPPLEKTHWAFASGGKSGTYYPLANLISDVVNETTGATIDVVATTGGGKENISLVSSGDADLAMVRSSTLDCASKGTGPFTGMSKVRNIAAVASLYSQPCHVVVFEDSGIESIADLKGKKISIGVKGTFSEAIALQILAAHGLSEDNATLLNLSPKESEMAMRDGLIPAAVFTCSDPNRFITEIASNKPIRILNITDEAAENLMNNYSFYAPATIPSDVYSTRNDVDTVGIRTLMVCRDDMSEDEVYQLTKSIYENLDVLSESPVWRAQQIILEEADWGSSAPFHPGAIKFYKEKGVY